MEPKKPKTLDERWNDVCTKSGLTPRELYQLAFQVFLQDKDRKKDAIDRMNMEFQEHSVNYQKRQMQVFEIQVVNEDIRQRLLAFKLNKKMNALARREKIKAWFAKPYLWVVSLTHKKPVAAPAVPVSVEPKPISNDTLQPKPQV